MRQFDLYEFLGYIAPGMLLLVGVRYVWPDAEKVLPISGISFGEFGVGIVLAYAAGQLLQTVGNIVETCWWWLWGGMPTDWPRTGKHELVAPAQAARVDDKVGRLLGDTGFSMTGTTRKQWYSITRQVYAAVSGAGRSARIDIFNGQYGLCRGIAASLIVLAVWGLIVKLPEWKIHLALVGLVVLAVYRMHRFGVHYGREVFVQFLQLSETPDKGGGK